MNIRGVGGEAAGGVGGGRGTTSRPGSRWRRAGLALSALGAVLGFAACQPGPAETPKGADATGKKPTAGTAVAADGGPPCTADVARKLTDKHLEALKKLADGQPSAAETAFYDLLRETPGDRVSAVLLPAARTDASELRRKASLQSSRLRPVSLPAATPQASAKPSGSFKLVKGEPVSAASPHEYLGSKGIREPIDFVAPEEVGQQLGDLPFSMAFYGNGTTIARYQDSVLALGSTEAGFRSVLLEPTILGVFPEANKPSGEATLYPEVNSALVVGSTLITQISHNGDGNTLAADAFVAAYDLTTNKVKWASQRGVGNVPAPVATATHLFTGFAGHDGTPTLQVLDLANGKLVAEEPLENPPGWYVLDGDSLLVWAPSGQRFKLPSAPPAPPPVYGDTVKAGDGLAYKLTDVRRCHLENAAKALAARDEVALRVAVEGLPVEGSTRRALQGALDFIEARKSGQKGIDLTEVQPRRGTYVPNATVRDMPNLAPLNLKINVAKVAPLSGDKPLMGSVIGVHPELRSDLFPNMYGSLSVYGAFGVGEDSLVNYGNRYLALISKDEVKEIVDLAFLAPDADTLGPESSAVSFLGRNGDVLLATVGNPTTTDSTAYIAALDPKTAKVLWRTDAGVSNYNVLWFADFAAALFTKKGKTEMVVFRIEDGKTITSLALKETPTEFAWDYRGAIYTASYSNSGERTYYFIK